MMVPPPAGDDLDAPLGLGKAARRAPPAPHYGLQRALTLGGLAAALTMALFLVKGGDGTGGEPFATARIEAAKKPEIAAAALPAETDITGSIGLAKGMSPGDTSDTQNGVRVTRLAQQPPGALIIQVPDNLGMQLAPAPDKRIVERSSAGLLPRIGLDGSRPSDIYARPVISGAKLKPGSPRIAIVVGGLGLNPAASGETIAKLPGAVTLAFAPYGPDLERQVARARADGHEVMLQVPMEPFDYPQNNPGPHMLSASAPASQNTADLHWFMSRFAGYTGIVNFLGGKFTSDDAAFAPVLRDIGARGLIYLDDGSSPRSLTAKLGAETGVATLQTDVVIDADTKSDAIEAQLLRLEGLARGRGFAIGSANAVPATIERVARFARALESRGIALVPVSAAAGRAAALAAGKSAP